MNLPTFHKIVISIVLTSLIWTNVSTFFTLHNDTEISAIEILDIDDKESDQEEKEEKEKEDKIISESNFIDYKYSINQGKGKRLNCIQVVHFLEISTPPPEQRLIS